MNNIIELKNIPGLEPEQSVKIWKMNYGFRSDLQGEVSNLSIKKDGEGGATVNLQALKIFTLVYGIYESETMGVEKPIDEDMGLNEAEKKNRIKASRKLIGIAGDFLYTKINEENQEPEESTKKKLNTPLTEN